MKINSENNNSAVLMELGARIKRNRIDMQLSQQDFAAKAGISTRTLSAAENGEDIRLSSLLRILRTLNCLENLDLLLPELAFDPESYRELAFDPESYRTLGKERKRVSRTSEGKDTSEWKWGDEE